MLIRANVKKYSLLLQRLAIFLVESLSLMI